MKYSKEKKKEHLALTRRLMVNKPNVSIAQIQNALSKAVGNNFDYNYIHKLVKNITTERIIRYDRITKSVILAKYEDFVRDLDITLNEIKESKTASNKDKIFAIRTLVENYKSIVGMLMDFGILERDLGKLKAEIVDVAALAKILRDAKNDERFNIKKSE